MVSCLDKPLSGPLDARRPASWLPGQGGPPSCRVWSPPQQPGRLPVGSWAIGIPNPKQILNLKWKTTGRNKGSCTQRGSTWEKQLSSESDWLERRDLGTWYRRTACEGRTPPVLSVQEQVKLFKMPVNPVFAQLTLHTGGVSFNLSVACWIWRGIWRSFKQ